MHTKNYTLKTGNILLCRTVRGIEGKIIRNILDCNVNHVAMTVVIYGEVYVTEAVGGERLGIVPIEDWLNQKEREITVIPTQCYIHDILKWCGKPYDNVSCWNLFLEKITDNWYGPKSGKGKDKIYCMELPLIVYNRAEFWKATPQKIMDEFKEYSMYSLHIY